MKVLPPLTAPPKKPTTRRHTPAPIRDYHAYLNCLRWEFGFVCPFCLLHEADLGSGASMSIEHRDPRSLGGAVADYANLLYSCQWCNRARSNRPLQDMKGRELLDPTTETWADHFAHDSKHQLLPKPGDANAAYTTEAYDPNEPRKVARRSARDALISDRLEFLALAEQRIDAALAAAADPSAAKEKAKGLLEAAQFARRAAQNARDELRRFRSVPTNAPATCRCPNNAAHSLPEGLDIQDVVVAD